MRAVRFFILATLLLNLPDVQIAGAQTAGVSNQAPVMMRGSVALKVGERLNFDNGEVQLGGGDLEWQLINKRPSLRPKSGAQFSVGNGMWRKYAACRTEKFSPLPVPASDTPPGSYVCFRTNEGRIGVFRVVTVSKNAAIVRVSYTTWAGN